MQIGYSQQTRIIDSSHDSLILDGGGLGPLHLPRSEADQAVIGDRLIVFVYADAKGQPVPTCKKPLVERDQCASLEVVSITHAGAFLDWGLEKNLLLPFAEQRRPLQVGHHECVLVYLDNSGRLAASSRLDHHLPEIVDGYSPWQEATLLIYQRTELGFKAVVDNRCIGLLYSNEIYKPVRVGQRHTGFIKRLRNDGRIDLALQPPSIQVKSELSERILTYLRENNGVCSIHDKSTPEDIKTIFQVSKKNYKKALSTLYKQRKITIEPDRIRLNSTSSDADIP
jgi:predicted RNA-binding protein (virulence factor B family)